MVVIVNHEFQDTDFKTFFWAAGFFKARRVKAVMNVAMVGFPDYQASEKDSHDFETVVSSQKPIIFSQSLLRWLKYCDVLTNALRQERNANASCACSQTITIRDL